jgi:hypothetical protein
VPSDREKFEKLPIGEISTKPRRVKQEKCSGEVGSPNLRIGFWRIDNREREWRFGE